MGTEKRYKDFGSRSMVKVAVLMFPWEKVLVFEQKWKRGAILSKYKEGCDLSITPSLLCTEGVTVFELYQTDH